jgi:choline dehydrogenase-like flavoprotein
MERPAVTTIPGRPLKSAYDYIVVGAGSAGAAVTRRLVDAGADVLLIEAGPPGIGGPLRIERSRSLHPIAVALIDGAAELGIPVIDDPNGATNEGAVPSNFNIRAGKLCVPKTLSELMT